MNKNRHTIRLKNYDYSQNGLYFVTICTENRECLLGDIVDGKMILNECGEIVNDVLNSLPDRYKQIELDLYQIMPNHIHMIIIIHPVVGAIHESPLHESPLPKSPNRRFIKRGDQRELLPQCIGYFKMNSSKQINQFVRAHHDAPQQQKIFQRNYYEHVIRNENELNKIREYIRINPQIWDRDRNNI